MQRRYIQVILPLRLEWEPCYVCDDSSINIGDRVSVRFAGRSYTGVVHHTDITPDVDESRVQAITGIAEGLPGISPEELEFWEFLASYYMCTIGEVYKAAYPAVKLRSEQIASDAAKKAQERENATHEKMIASTEARIARLVLRACKKREELEARASMKRSSSSVSEKIRKEIDSLETQIASAKAALEALKSTFGNAVETSDTKTEAMARHESVRSKPPGKPIFLLNPSSEDYLGMAKKAVSEGSNVLVLVPEVALGDSLAREFEERFPGIVSRISSRNTPVQRRKVADDLRKGSCNIIVGTRISLFLPFQNLGLVIVTDEQDPSYKQTEPAPRYNSRDAALVLARIHGAQAVLGSPAPSMESCRNIATSKYSVRECGTNTTVPEIIDISEERPKRGMLGLFSRKMLAAIAETPGRVALIRGWEKEEELAPQIAQWLKERDVCVMSFQESRRSELGAYGIVCVLQADVLMSRSDFRADERAVQTIIMLCKQCSGIRLVIQTAKSEHPVFHGGNVNDMLQERKDFSLPPFSRLVDIIFNDAHEKRRQLMMSRFPIAGTLYPDRIRIALPGDATLSKRKKDIFDSVILFEKRNHYPGHIVIDADPV